jgi:hypothetical protein
MAIIEANWWHVCKTFLVVAFYGFLAESNAMLADERGIQR